MVIASKTYSKVFFSRSLNEKETKELNSLHNVYVPECYIEKEMCKALGIGFYCINYWRYKDGELILEQNPNEDNFFMLETLYYLLVNYFAPKGISLSGYVVSVDEIFGNCTILHIYNDKIFILKELIEYFENLDLSLNSKFELMIKEIF